MRSWSTTLNRFAREQSGIVLIYVAVMLPVLIGIASLAIDASRLFILQGSLQRAADALALAGAAELDGRADAHLRAALAMETLVENRKKFASDGLDIVIASGGSGDAVDASDAGWRFLWNLPASDEDPIDETYVSASSAQSAFLEVTIEPTAFRTIFPVSFFRAVAPDNVRATAVAGLGMTDCEAPAMMICADIEYGAATLADLASKIGQIRDLRARRNNVDAVGSGQFQLVDPGGSVNGRCSTGGSMGRLDAVFSGMAAAGSCRVTQGVCPVTGYRSSLDAALNTRFDIYEGRYSNLTPDELPYVIPASRFKWYSGQSGGCVGNVDVTMDGSARSKYVIYPTYGMTAAQYAASNYPGAILPDLDGNSSLITWREVNAYEISLAGAPTAIADINTCYRQTAAGVSGVNPLEYLSDKSRRDNRRMMKAALVNCQPILNGSLIDPSGRAYDLNGTSQYPLPVIAYGEFFITQPINKVSVEVEASKGQFPRNFNADLPSQITYSLRDDFGTLDLNLASAPLSNINRTVAAAFNAAIAGNPSSSAYQKGLRLCFLSATNNTLHVQYWHQAPASWPSGITAAQYYSSTTCTSVRPSERSWLRPAGVSNPGPVYIFGLGANSEDTVRLELSDFKSVEEAVTISEDLVRLFR